MNVIKSDTTVCKREVGMRYSTWRRGDEMPAAGGQAGSDSAIKNPRDRISRVGRYGTSGLLHGEAPSCSMSGGLG